jgi:aminomethyltransferase
MAQTSADSLKTTPLNSRHRALGARLVDFSGWEMPVEYSGLTKEHLAVRETAGLFDVSHMGEIEIAGDDALAAVQELCTNDAAQLSIGDVQYSALLTENGTVVDDILVYKLADGHYMLVVNAGNIAKDFTWIRQRITGVGDAVAVNTSSRYALIAVQGPLAAQIVQTLTEVELDTIPYYTFATGEVSSIRATISRTGYTGEDGFELFVPPQAAQSLWDSIQRAGESDGLLPAGLGARDTLRLEAGMRLCGQDMDEETTLLEAGLGWIVGWEKDNFIGKAALSRQRDEGLIQRLVGFEMDERGIARHGYAVYAGAEQVGTVTSGTQTPFLKKAIGMAYVPIKYAKVDSELSIDIRGRRAAAHVVKMPWYRRSSDRKDT